MAAQDWRKDRVLTAALLVALLLRIVPIIVFPQSDCVRDECIYRMLATGIIEGEGLNLTSKGWLAAPGYPYALALMKSVFGLFWSIKFVQIALSLVSVVTLYKIAEIVDDLKTARVAAWLFAVHPTLAYFTNTMWIETLYIFLILWAVYFVLRARETGDWRWGAGVGLSLGIATLFRGMATYLPPIFLLALLWPDDGKAFFAGLKDSVTRRWKIAIAMVAAVVLSVAPYSIHGSQKYGGFMVTDATVGHVLFLGNNDFPPLTFDYGNGMLSGPIFARYLRLGRRPCDRTEPAVQSSKCEVEKAVDWIKENPDKFVGRIPMRLAQLLNPNSFFTRAIRWGYWSPIPWWFKEFLVTFIIFSSALVTVGGTVGAFARAKGAYGVMAVGTVLYTLVTICLMYGMTRFRLPLVPLWIVYLASVMAHPVQIKAALSASTPRAASLLLVIPMLLVLMAWYLPTGYPMFW